MTSTIVRGVVAKWLSQGERGAATREYYIQSFDAYITNDPIGSMLIDKLEALHIKVVLASLNGGSCNRRKAKIAEIVM